MKQIVCSTLLLLGLSQPAASPSRALTGAHVVGIGGTADIEDATIVIRDGRIAAIGPSRSVTVPAGAQTVRIAGTFVVPGFVSAHVHISDVDGLRPRAYTAANTARQLGVLARYGVTTVWSLGGEQAPAFEARNAQSVATLDRARIYLAGEVITAANAAEAKQAVARVAATKPDVIKIRVDDNLGIAP
jgi:imidazolonepropionase-like amidohydrolase